MQGENIGEVRGVADGDQNLEGNMAEIAQAKPNEFPDGRAYEKKSGDMKKLTEIEKKTKAGQELSRDELIFLYEIESPISYFGYEKDPRIGEIRETRKIKEDAPIVFECRPEEIAWSKNEINENTKAYVGPLFKDIFQSEMEKIYTSFPEEKIEQGKMEVGGLTEEELEREIKNKKDNQGRNYQIYSYAQSMMKNPDFAESLKERLSNPESINLVRLKVKDLGFTKNPTTDELYSRAKELGLELCPAETGPHLRIKYEDVFKREQPMYEYLRIGMKQITDSDGSPYVFYVKRLDAGFCLDSSWAKPSDEWRLAYQFVFRLRKLET